ncbi:MAG TPA: MTAP family purine nucleoside phosphorylase [Desulfitobacteriaceae bacterium]|nr:MTAP family purine nucleoside phosphorylase [Desulfitobacteriaceae bacterium]
MIPQAEVGLICGSGTNTLLFPMDYQVAGISILAEKLVFATPYGTSPKFWYFSYSDKKILTCRMHGWRSGVTRSQASQQIFWVFEQAGVKTVLTEGGVGGINHLLQPRDIVIPHDYLDYSMRKDVSLGSPYLLIMRQAICPELVQSLYAGILTNNPPGNVFRRGVYVCTDGRHFESPAEIQMFKQLGGDIVGQSLCPEVYLAREIGCHFASVQLVVNYAEGIVEDWHHAEMADIYYNSALIAGKILLASVAKLPETFGCSCLKLRQPTLLRDCPDSKNSEAKQ